MLASCTLTGLIPACAGKTCCVACLMTLGKAHPRVCGENLPAFDTIPTTAGSSPRVRGKLYGYAGSGLVMGLIPACAGKTKISGEFYQEYGAHPRVCGENAAFKALDALDEGSSPRVRGKPSRG